MGKPRAYPVSLASGKPHFVRLSLFGFGLSELGENHRSHDQLIAYKATLEMQRLWAETLEEDLIDVADRLAQLGDRIEIASFEERRRAIEQLVKEILVQPQMIDGKLIPIVTITYRFNEPFVEITPSPSSMIVTDTPALVVIAVTPSNHVFARPLW